ncbi:GCC2 and GCC3 domain protein [Gracilaria domingensis]|nr:GCC2 and GCC3 domain protein [Gracilaria domingensis]
MPFRYVLFLLLIALSSRSTAGQWCPPGNYITAGEECEPCIAGSFQPLADQTSCIPCQEGLVSASNSSTECRRCGENETASRFQNQCDCIDGFVRSPESGECVPCPPGKFQRTDELVGRQELCLDCFRGTFNAMFGQSECLPCPEGTDALPGADRCVSCPQGSTFLERFRCGFCPEFHTPNGIGEEPACIRNALPPQRLGSDGVFEQLLCPGGLGIQFDIAECSYIPCPDGTVVMADGSCGTCRAGTFYNSTQYECDPCPARHFLPQESVIAEGCFKCASDSFSMPGSAECVKCPINQGLMSDGQCGTCPPGTFYNEDQLRCDACTENTFSRGGVTENNRCEDCPNFTYSLPGSSSCREDLCPRDMAPMRMTGECGTCPPGMEYDRSSASCQTCGALSPFNPFVTIKSTSGLFGCRRCNGFATENRTICV